MKKKNIIKDKRDFNRIIKFCKYIKSKNFIIYYEDNTSTNNMFGFCVSKKGRTAVERNYIRRQIKDIVDNIDLPKTLKNRNYIIITRDKINLLSYNDKKIELFNLFKKMEEN